MERRGVGSRATTTSTEQSKGERLLQEAILAGAFDIENQQIRGDEKIKIDSKKPIKPIQLAEPLPPRNRETITLAPISQNAKKKATLPLKKKKSTIRETKKPQEELEREDPDQDLEQYFEANLMKDSELMLDIDTSLD